MSSGTCLLGLMTSGLSAPVHSKCGMAMLRACSGAGKCAQCAGLCMDEFENCPLDGGSPGLCQGSTSMYLALACAPSCAPTRRSAAAWCSVCERHMPARQFLAACKSWHACQLRTLKQSCEQKTLRCLGRLMVRHFGHCSCAGFPQLQQWQ